VIFIKGKDNAGKVKSVMAASIKLVII